MRQDNLAHMAFLEVVEANNPPCLKADPEAFFPHEMDEFGIRAAKAICAQCPIRYECLEFAYATDDQHAILGGTTPRERRALLRKKAA
jgi:WhiB family redox-sensing transcriptional regulator